MINEGYVVLVAFDVPLAQVINERGNVSMYHFASFTLFTFEKSTPAQDMFRNFQQQVGWGTHISLFAIQLNPKGKIWDQHVLKEGASCHPWTKTKTKKFREHHQRSTLRLVTFEKFDHNNPKGAAFNSYNV